MVISVDPDTIPQLRKLQKKDQEIKRIQKLLGDIPRLREVRKKKLEALELGSENAHAELQKRRMLSREADEAVRQKEQDIAKMNGQLNTAKSNDEYRGLQTQIARVEQERDALVDQGIALLDEIESAETQDGESRQTLEAGQKEFDDFSAQLDEDQKGFEGDLTELEGQREEIAKTIKATALDLYDRVFGARDGVAMATISGKVCQGCFVNLTTNDVVLIRSGKELKTCPSCSRILYEE